MNESLPQFKFDLRDLTAEARRRFGNRIGDVQINLPFVSFSVQATDAETQAAREIIIRLKNRRVLDARECCDNCIDDALDSLQTTRAFLVDQQVKLAHATGEPLYLLTEYMLEAIRQFLTFKQRLDELDTEPLLHVPSDFRRQPRVREQYFAALEILRGHLNGCRTQIAAIAGISLPTLESNFAHPDAWELHAYEQSRLSDGE